MSSTADRREEAEYQLSLLEANPLPVYARTPERDEGDVLMCFDLIDREEIIELFPELARIRYRSIGEGDLRDITGLDGSFQTIEGDRMRNVYISRRAFFMANYKGNYTLWRNIDNNQLSAGKHGKIIIL